MTTAYHHQSLNAERKKRFAAKRRLMSVAFTPDGGYLVWVNGYLAAADFRTSRMYGFRVTNDDIRDVGPFDSKSLSPVGKRPQVFLMPKRVSNELLFLKLLVGHAVSPDGKFVACTHSLPDIRPDNGDSHLDLQQQRSRYCQRRKARRRCLFNSLRMPSIGVLRRRLPRFRQTHKRSRGWHANLEIRISKAFAHGVDRII